MQRIENFTQKATPEETLAELNALQKEWLEIGLVPIKKKDKINKDYNEAVRKKLQELQLPHEQKQKFAFKNTIRSAHQSPQSGNKLEKMISTLQAEIVQLETNIEFFAKSKNADALREEVNKKIAKRKAEIAAIKQEIRAMADAAKTDE